MRPIRPEESRTVKRYSDPMSVLEISMNACNEETAIFPCADHEHRGFQMFLFPLKDRELTAIDLSADRHFRDHRHSVAHCETGLEHLHTVEFHKVRGSIFASVNIRSNSMR